MECGWEGSWMSRPRWTPIWTFHLKHHMVCLSVMLLPSRITCRGFCNKRLGIDNQRIKKGRYLRCTLSSPEITASQSHTRYSTPCPTTSPSSVTVAGADPITSWVKGPSGAPRNPCRRKMNRYLVTGNSLQLLRAIQKRTDHKRLKKSLRQNRIWTFGRRSIST